MAEADERARVVEVARSFLNTPYKNNAALKGVGVDCASLLAMVYSEAGVRPPIQIGSYSSQWHLHSTDPLYEKAILAQGFREIDAGGLGDIALYFQGLQFAHGAIITGLEPMKIVQAFAPARRVIEGVETEFGALVIERKKFFSPW